MRWRLLFGFGFQVDGGVCGVNGVFGMSVDKSGFAGRRWRMGDGDGVEEIFKENKEIVR